MGRLARCMACRGRIKVDTVRGWMSCPLCGLTLIDVPGVDDLPPAVVPRAGGDACWKALADEQRLPAHAGAAQMRESRLLLVPYWRFRENPTMSHADGGLLVSGCDLLPIGLPPMTRGRQEVRGLQVRQRTASGDAMGRLENAAAGPEADVIDVTLGPDLMTPKEAVESWSAGPAGHGWQLVYHPLWSFRYTVHEKEQFHLVDATTASPIGPARRGRPGAVAAASAATMLLIFLAAVPLLGAAAALPAWLGSTAAMWAAILRQRAG